MSANSVVKSVFKKSGTSISASVSGDKLVHEAGGIEADISAVAKGDILAGSGTGAIGIIAASGKSDGDVLTLQADGTVDYEAAAGGGASAIDDLSDAVTTATSNIGLGSTAIDSITTGDYNVGLGDNAGTAITEGDDNTIMGYNAGSAITTGSDNIFIGSNAGAVHTTGGGNVVIGYDAMSDTDADATSLDGTNNVFIGFQAASGTWVQGPQTGQNHQNVAIGPYVMRNIGGKCRNNTAIGALAGDLITSGDANVLLGWNAGTALSPVSVTTGNNVICLGNSTLSDLYCSDDSISTSDERDKTDIETFTHGLDFVNQMRPVTFRWDRRAWYCEELEDEDGHPITITDEEVANAVPDGSMKRAEIQIGFIGQEVQAIEQQYGYSQVKEDGMPDEDTELVVDTNTKGLKMGLQYARVVPILVKAVQELSAKVEALENE